MPTYPAKHTSITIDRPFDEVYAFLAEPSNIPLWASGLGSAFQSVEPFVWTAETTSGPVTIQFSNPNGAGILDHRVLSDSHDPVLVPMRVVPNGTGAEVAITIFQPVGMSDAYFERDAHTIEHDLQTLKRLLESE